MNRGWVASVPILMVFAILPSTDAATFHVHTQGFSFNPNNFSLAIGDTVTWDNHDGVTHTVTDVNCPRAGGIGPCEFDSVFTMSPGKTFVHLFNDVSGAFDYKCTIHGFTGKLFVVDPNAKPDFAIGHIKFINNSLPGGLTSKRIEVKVDNIGTMNAPASKLQVAYFYQGEWKQISLVDVQQVPASGGRIFTVTWVHTGKIGDFPIRASADDTALVDEMIESNNQATKVVSLLTPAGVVPGMDLLDPV